MALRFALMYWSYNLGMSAVASLTKHAKEFTHAASVMGIFIVGALISNMGSTSLEIVFSSGGLTTNVQGQLDSILPRVIPLALTLMCYALLKKKWTPIKCIVLLLVIGIVGCMFGVWATGGAYTALIPVPWHA